MGCIYYEDFRFGNSYSVEHFAPEVDYTNKCAVDFSPGKPGKEALDSLRRSDNVRSYMISASRRKDVSERRKVIEARWGRFSCERPAAARTWETLDAVSRWYLLMRSCDWLMYGKEFADKSFPDPSNSDYSGVVAALVWLFEEHEAELIEKLEDAEEAKEREHIEKYCAESVEKIVVSPPEQLTPRVLDSAQIRAVRCIEEIKHGPQAVNELAGTIDEFAVFCKRLAQPENLIKARHVNNGKYCFALYSTVSPNGYHRLHLERENEGAYIVDWQKSEFVKKGNDAENTLMVQRTGENITLGINGHIVAKETVSGLTPGHVGLFVGAYKEDSYAEARFRNFLIYAIEK